ncbi:sulfurtransferase [Cryobacterium algoricola]|uniref:Sulfurtransferase n=1 Tax=Cryobacterium algoricola TaxID=1259183 RepID=A0ABY2ID23_9MICO|nr:sulfurtransferase [Cryobacterium algoricola]
MNTLISAEDLARLLETREDIRVLDVRWALLGPSGRDEYAAGHLPGAVYVDLETELARPGAPEDGRHPLPAIEDLQAAARRWGIHDDDTVVVYDDLSLMSAARAWWLLRHAGHRNVLLLDGALAEWRKAGLPLVTGEQPDPPIGTAHLSYGSLGTIDADTAAAIAHTGILLDARAGARYRGETEPVDPRAGHIPGAVSAPTTDTLADDGRFLPADQLRAQFESLGVRPMRPIGVYCGSGVTAAHEIAALTIAGFVPYLYPGSWSQWSNLPDRPVETGDSARGGFGGFTGASVGL